MPTATTTSHDTGQTSSRRTTTQPVNTPTTQLERSAANRLRATMAAVRLAFTWLRARKTLVPEQRSTAARELAALYDSIKSEAQRRLGTLFDASDYSSTLDGLSDMEWSVVPIEPRPYLVTLSPEVYRQEQARGRERFESAIELAEQAFATELQWLTAHLAERLTGLHDGQPKVFRDSAVENLREFFERFRWLNIWSSPELDALVQQAQQTITGIEPQTLRDSNRLGDRLPLTQLDFDFSKLWDNVLRLLRLPSWHLSPSLGCGHPGFSLPKWPR